MMIHSSKIESAIIEFLNANPSGCLSVDLQYKLLELGYDRNMIRSAISQLWDFGTIKLGVDRKLYLNKSKSSKQPKTATTK